MRLLALCVDRDDDIGQKAKVRGPVIGEDENIEVAKKLLLADPEDSDGNTIFEAVKIKRENKDVVEVVTLTGHKDRGYKADRNITKQMEEIMRKFEVDGVILVTDGADDDQIIPIIQSFTKIISKKTVIIKQAKELEKSYYVIKQALQDPHFARLIFGLPGIILIIISLFQELGMKLVVLAIGIYLILKGFGIEEPIINQIRELKETTSISRITFPLYVGSFLLLLLGLWAAIDYALRFENLLVMGVNFVKAFLPLLTISILAFIAGRVGDRYYREEFYYIRKYLYSSITLVAVAFVINMACDLIVGSSSLAAFIYGVIITFLATLLAMVLTTRIYISRYLIPRLKAGMDVMWGGKIMGKIAEVRKKDRFIVIENNKGGRRKVPLSKAFLIKDYVIVKL